MSISYQAFNSMLSAFFGDLADTFDEYKSISDAKVLLDGYISVNSETDVPVKAFIDVFTPHKDLLMEKNEELFEVCQIPMVSDSGFDISKEWGTLDEDNKECIWDYLHQLFGIGNTLLGLGGDVISQIEDVAHGFIERVNNKELTQEEVQDPMFIAKEIMGNKDLMAAISSSGIGSDSSGFNPMDMFGQIMSNPSLMNSINESGLVDSMSGVDPSSMLEQLMNNPDLKKALGKK